MFTLSDASRDIKQLLKFAGIFITAVVVIVLILRVVFFIKETIYPTPPPKPEVTFGKLQPQSFPANAVNQNLTYSINTLTGNLPNLNSQSKVYRIKTLQPDLLAVNKFQDKISSVGFAKGYTAISDKIFEWKSNQNYGGIEKRIRFNTINNNFTITSVYTTDADILKGKNLPTETKAIDSATSLLDNMKVMPADIDLEKTKSNLFSIQNNSLSTATSLSNAQIIEVNFFQKDIDKLPIFYGKPNSSNISILVAGGGYQGQIVGANFIYQPVSDEFSTYPLKSVSVAYEELKNGQAYIASYFGTSTNITITNAFLAYYISSQAQDFLMPIIVFEGNEGFFAYVPAVTDEWINK
nr:hypothetical protein [Candidatus Levybacteria bacterium]